MTWAYAVIGAGLHEVARADAREVTLLMLTLLFPAVLARVPLEHARGFESGACATRAHAWPARDAPGALGHRRVSCQCVTIPLLQ
jgi:hypothetical protein